MLIMTDEEPGGESGPALTARENVKGVERLREFRRGLTQTEIDARAQGWEHRSNSTNALMARVLAELPRVSNPQ
jgi:hypothetical protein